MERAVSQIIKLKGHNAVLWIVYCFSHISFPEIAREEQVDRERERERETEIVIAIVTSSRR